MAKLKIFSPESFAGGGSYFNPGVYRIEEARFVLYDFNGAAADTPCLHCKLQQLDKDGAEVGEALDQYWGVGASQDFQVVDKGKSIESIGSYGTVWKLSDFAVFVDNLGKAGFDRDKFEEENDVSTLDGLVGDWGRIPSPRDPSRGKVKLDSTGNQRPKEVVVMVKLHDSAPKGKPSAKAAAKPSGKAASKEDSNGAGDADEIVAGYLAKRVLIDKNAKGIEKLQARMALGNYIQKELGGDADVVKSASKVFNSKLEDFLTAAGWHLDGQTIKQDVE